MNDIKNNNKQLDVNKHLHIHNTIQIYSMNSGVHFEILQFPLSEQINSSELLMMKAKVVGT